MVRSTSTSLFLGILSAAILPSVVLGNVNLQLQTVANPVIVGNTVEIRLIASGTPAAQNIGFVQTVLTWDPTKLQLTGFSTSGAFAWESQGFFNDSSGDGLNAPFIGVPANDGNAVFRAQASPPASAPTTGLRVTTFQFLAIDTGTNSPITVPAMIGVTPTVVLNDDIPFGFNVPINTISNTTVTINCTLSSQCNDNNRCTDDTCSASQCSFVNDNTNNPDDGLRCNGVEQSCSGGTIIYAPGQGPVDCSSLNTICTLGVCNEPGGNCTASPINNGGACNDGLFCTPEDVCFSGTCTGTGIACPDQFCDEAADACVDCLTNAHCQDTEFCNSLEQCVAGSCAQGPDPCPGQLCVESTDSCVDCFGPLDCDDGIFCNGVEQCVSNNCTGGTPPCTAVGELCCEDSNTCSTGCCVDADCDDGQLCSADICDLGGNCVNFASPTVCQDTTFCNGIERCVESPVGVFTCQAANTPACPVSEVCCESADSCQPDCCSDADCIDSFYCNGVETCLAGVCQSGTPPNCSAFTNDCNVGSCNETLDACQSTPVNNNGSCNDQNVCTYGDKCTNGACDGCLQGEAGCTPQGLVNLVWDPPSQTALVGSTIQLKLIARSSVAAAQVVDGIDMILDWDQTRLQLTPGTGLNPNPIDPCTGAGGCPPNTYDWLSSGFPSDCFSDSINLPCSGTPSNDGDAYYGCLSQILTAPASATAVGLHVTSFKFTVLPGASGSTQVAFNPCFAADGNTITRVIGGSAPGTIVTGSLGPPALINIQQCSNNAQCNDTLDCNGVETCVSNSCVPGTPLCSPPTPVCIEASNTCVACTLNSHCSDGEFCNGSEVCQANNCFPGTPPCTGGLQCDESTDDCVECFTNIECDDGIPCTNDQCLLGDCYNSPVDSLCDNGLFCDGPEVCNEGTGCASMGNPCCDPLACNEGANTCGGGCLSSTVVVVGSRYVAVTPADGPNPVSILFTGDSADSSVSCISLYVQANGALGTTPFTQTPAQWGTIYVRDTELRPGKKYTVCTGCVTGFSAKVSITMWRWGDGDNSGTVTLDDILCVLKGFAGDFNTPPSFCTKYSTDLNGPGCVPDFNITLDDILQVLGAFSGATSPPSAICPNVCP